MNQKTTAYRYFFLFPLFCMLLSCTQDSYEKGEGRYSQMRGDFAEMHINSDKKAFSITTDDGDEFPLKEQFASQWIDTPDTEIVSAGQVPCAHVKSQEEFEGEVRTDPVKFESIWLSKSGKYVNLSLQLKVGQTDDETAKHQLGFLSDGLTVNPDGSRTLHVFLSHDQGNVPEYYTVQAYVSIPTSQLKADSVCFRVNTYSGIVEKTLSVQPIAGR